MYLTNFSKRIGMVTAIQDKNKTTITISRRLSKKELERVINYINLPGAKSGKRVSKKKIQELADEITEGAWKRLMKERGAAL